MNNQAAIIYQQLLLTSSSCSDESEDEYRRGNRGPQVLRPRIQNFVFDVVEKYNQLEFRENFRMYRSTFDHILKLIEIQILPHNHNMGRHPVDPSYQLMFTLWYFSTPDCYRSICSRFNFGKATALRTVRRVTNAILSLSNTFVKFPTGNYLEVVKTAFSEMGFPNTIGALDGSYIPIPTPKENGLAYICRKNFAALTLQVVCDHRMLFTHCYTGEVGSTHDANVLKRSEVYNYLTINQLEMFPDDTHLIGDKAYPCLQTLMVPIKNNGHLTDIQKNFNFRLSSCRCIIERAIAMLKTRFRCLKFFDIKNIEWAVKYILACCILHNICILQNDVIEIEDVVVAEENDYHEPLPMEFQQDLQRLGSIKRNNLCRLLAQ